MIRETELYELLRGTADACFISGPDGSIRYWNPAAEKLFGFQRDEVLARPCSSVIQGVAQDDRPVCTSECHVRELGLADQPISSFDLKVKTASGGRRWVSVSILTAAVTSGERLLVHLCRDLNHRKRLENVTEAFLVEIANFTGRQLQELITPAPPPHFKLNRRERQVLELIALGRSSKDIAEQLKIKPATARNHTQRLLHKLGVHSRAEAVLVGTREHLF